MYILWPESLWKLGRKERKEELKSKGWNGKGMLRILARRLRYDISNMTGDAVT
jgi:hypothetical protein